jgi:hypothetical protein
VRKIRTVSGVGRKRQHGSDDSHEKEQMRSRVAANMNRSLSTGEVKCVTENDIGCSEVVTEKTSGVL